MQDYMKKIEDSFEELDLDIDCDYDECCIAPKRKSYVKSFMTCVCLMGAVIAAFCCVPSLNGLITIDNEDGNMVAMTNVPVAATTAKKDLISIPTGIKKQNPFLPYRDISGASSLVQDAPKFDLIDPPGAIDESSDAIRVMNTVVSGILYDKYSPSAILNIEGSDYLVKKGDVVNNYKVLAIAQDSVTVKLGENSYKAGIGEILTEGSVNHNDVSNLDNKFGGNR